MMKKNLYVLCLLSCIIYLTSFSMAPYTVNLWWFNAVLNARQQYIHSTRETLEELNEHSANTTLEVINKHSANTLKELKEHFLKPIFEWAAISNPKSKINVWFDGEMVPALAVQATQVLIDGYMQLNEGIAPIVLRDVRTLPEVIELPEIFSDKTPIFFRLDLARVIAAVRAIEDGETPYFVHADLDVERLSQRALFDNFTMHNLRKYGTVMARGTTMGTTFENSFFIVSGHNSHLLEALKWAIIHVNLMRAHHVLDHPNDFESKELKQVVYDSYMDMFKYLHHLDGLGTLRVEGSKQGIYSKEKHEWRPFQLRVGRGVPASSLKLYTRDRIIQPDAGSDVGFPRIPTKYLLVPPSQQNTSGYDHTKLIKNSPRNSDYEVSSCVATLCSSPLSIETQTFDSVRSLYDSVLKSVCRIKDEDQRFRSAKSVISLNVSENYDRCLGGALFEWAVKTLLELESTHFIEKMFQVNGIHWINFKCGSLARAVEQYCTTSRHNSSAVTRELSGWAARTLQYIESKAQKIKIALASEEKSDRRKMSEVMKAYRMAHKESKDSSPEGMIQEIAAQLPAITSEESKAYYTNKILSLPLHEGAVGRARDLYDFAVQALSLVNDDYSRCKYIHKILVSPLMHVKCELQKQKEALLKWVAVTLPVIKTDCDKEFCVRAIVAMPIPDEQMNDLCKPIYAWAALVLPHLKALYLKEFLSNAHEICSGLSTAEPDFSVAEGFTELLHRNSTQLASVNTSIQKLLRIKALNAEILTQAQWTELENL